MIKVCFKIYNAETEKLVLVEKEVHVLPRIEDKVTLRVPFTDRVCWFVRDVIHAVDEGFITVELAELLSTNYVFLHAKPQEVHDAQRQG